METSYKKFWVILIQKYITKVLLRAEVGISAGTMSKHDKREMLLFLPCCEFVTIGHVTLVIFMSVYE